MAGVRAACLLAISSAILAASNVPRQVLVLSRHGVRGPYGPDGLEPSETNLQRYSKNKYKFPVRGVEWGTSDDPNELVSQKITAHGAQVVENMGKYFGKYLYPTLAQSECSHVFAYADDNERDIVTAQRFLQGFKPTCPLVPTTNGSRLLFEQGQDPTATCPDTSELVYSGIVGSLTTDNVVRLYRPEIAYLNELLDCCEPVVCQRNASESCDLFDVPSRWVGKFYEPWQDSLSEAQFLSEWFLLQALNNMSIPANLTIEDIVALGSLHKAHMDLVTNQFNAENFGSTLLVHFVASMQQTIQKSPVTLAPGDGPHLLHSLSNKFLFYAGHDINLLFFRNLLRLEWETEHWLSNQPNPGSMLVFELHSYKNNSARYTDVFSLDFNFYRLSTVESDYYVEAFFVTASPRQIREAQELTNSNPPDRVRVSIPHCSEEIVIDGKPAVRCNFTDFKRAVGLAVREACVSPTLAKYATTLRKTTHETSWQFKIVVVGIVSLVLLVVVWKYITVVNTPASSGYARLT